MVPNLRIAITQPAGPVYGLRVGEQHTNNRGGCLVVVLSTLTDVALDYGALAAHGETPALFTTSSTTDFTGTASVDD